MKKNTPLLWKNQLPVKSGAHHKYDYGLALIYGAPALTGATRLAAAACARMGCGLTTVIAPHDAANIYRSSLPPHIMVSEDAVSLTDKSTACLYGPGGLSAAVPQKSSCPTVLDADALADLSFPLSYPAVLTPHEGEFKRLFPELEGSREERARKAATLSGAAIILKGKDTIIAAADGSDVIINEHASPWLASAGSGDVLAGMVTGLIAQGMPLFLAASAAVWIHGEAAQRIGPYMVASDIESHLAEVLTDLINL